jgi:hypothetical protein
MTGGDLRLRPGPLAERRQMGAKSDLLPAFKAPFELLATEDAELS